MIQEKIPTRLVCGGTGSQDGQSEWFICRAGTHEHHFNPYSRLAYMTAAELTITPITTKED